MADLKPDQIQRLVKGFIESIAGYDEMDYLLFFELAKPLSDISEEVARPILFARVIKAAQQGGWILDLLKAAIAQRPRVTAFKDVHTELLGPPMAAVGDGPALTPWQVCLIGGAQMPFINRETLRDAVRRLEETEWPRILVVQGGSGCGKSHSWHFIRYRADASKHRVVWIDLSKLKQKLPPERHITPEMIAETLCDQLGQPRTLIPDKDDEQYSRWNMVFCDRLSAKLGEGQRWWIFIDEFNSVLLPQATADLFKELAARVDKVMAPVRLVLIGYDDTLPLDAAGSAYKDIVGPITDDHLAGFFKNVHAMRGRAPNNNELAEHVARVRIKVTEIDPRPNKTIGNEAACEARRFLAGL